MLLHNLHTRGHEHSRTKHAQMDFPLVQWQYKAEASGSRAFRLKSVAIRRLDFARDMQDAPKNTGPSRTVGRHKKMRLRMVHFTNFKRCHSHSQSSCATVVVGQFTPLHSTVFEVLHFGVWAWAPSDQQANQEEQQGQFHAKQGAA